jgi:hypothetical protein
MSSTASAAAAGKKETARAVGQPNSEAANNEDMTASQSPDSSTGRKQAGFGLPCAKCKTYYAADLKQCPVCKNPERVSPTAFKAPSVAAISDEVPDPVVLEEERERFLREFKAKVFASQLPLSSPAGANCIRQENHPSGIEAATVCQGCYEQLQERVDVLEAALHMDLKDAAQIIYDAVWADPSDSSKTYQNAAHALLTELRKRSGVTPTFGLLQPMLD